MRPIEIPVTVKKPFSPGDDNTVTTHPAFGQISVHKVSGTCALYGSDFLHHNTVRLAIHRSELNRNLSHDWHFSREDIVEVEMSEAQWATFVSSFNQGSGVPCTLRYVANDETPYKPFLPDPDLRKEYSAEISKTMEDSLDRLRALQDKVRNSSMAKGLMKEISSSINQAIREMEANVPFVKESFDKHIETSIEKAKVEVHAYVNNVIRNAGLNTLQQGQVLQLENENEEG